MITEIVLWKMPDGMSREEILNKFRATVPAWQANPSLIHKAFLFDESSRRGGGVYLWKNIEAAKQAHGPAFQDRIKAVFGANAEFQYFEAPVVIDNTTKQVLTALIERKSFCLPLPPFLSSIRLAVGGKRT